MEVDKYSVSRVAGFENIQLTGDGTTTMLNTNAITPANGVAESLLIVGRARDFTDGVFTFTLEDSPDNSVWSDVDADLILPNGGLVVDEADNIRMGYIGKQQHVRVKVVATGVTSGTFLSLVAVHSNLDFNPVGLQPAA